LKVSPVILAKYAGTYDLRDKVPGMPPGFPPPLTVSLADGQLYVGAVPLIPQSETSFEWFDGSSVEFSRDASGAVTGVTGAFQGQPGFYRKR
jgi:hypothetical protein